MPVNMTDDELIAAISGHESLAPLTTQQMLDLGKGVKAPPLKPKPTAAVEGQMKEMEDRVREVDEEHLRNNPPFDQEEPSVKPAPITPAGLLVGDVAEAASDAVSGDFATAAASILTALPFVPEALKEPLGAIFIAASRVKSRADLDDISKLAKEGKFKEIREKHDVTVGKDDIPRVEIDDSEVKFNARTFTKATRGKLSIDRVVDHPTLFNAIPDLRDMDIRIDGNATFSSFSDSGVRDLITVAGKDARGDKSMKAIMSSLVHEVQHAVQKREGFDRGTSIESLTDAGFKPEDAATLYFAATGEAEARDAARRFVKGRKGLPANTKERIGEGASDAAITHPDLVAIPFDKLQRTPELKAGATGKARQAAEEIKRLALP